MTQVDVFVLSSASGIPHATRQTANLKEAASQFEAMLVTQMMQSARGSWKSDDEGQDSTMLELGEQQFAQALASSGGLGIAKMVVTGLTKHENR
jgi:Rod binding domain-containing protein